MENRNDKIEVINLLVCTISVPGEVCVISQAINTKKKLVPNWYHTWLRAIVFDIVEVYGDVSAKILPIKDNFRDKTKTQRIKINHYKKKTLLKLSSYEFAYPHNGSPKDTDLMGR